MAAAEILGRGVAVCGGRGGVGTSSIAAGLAATAASMGWRTLAVDLDPRGHLGRDLGYGDRSDRGRGLLQALSDGSPVRPLKGVRDGLDVVGGGGYTEQLLEVLRRRAAHEGTTAPVTFRSVLVGLGRGYDLVVVDAPPGPRELVDAALTSVRFLLVPVRSDRGLDGVERVSDRYLAVRDAGLNPDLELLGIALFGFAAAERRLLVETRAELEVELDGVAPVFDRFIRDAGEAARHMREHGVVASEYLMAGQEALPRYETEPGPGAFDRDAGGLAEDYWELTREILRRVSRRVSAPLAEAQEPVA